MIGLTTEKAAQKAMDKALAKKDKEHAKSLKFQEEVWKGKIEHEVKKALVSTDQTELNVRVDKLESDAALEKTYGKLHESVNLTQEIIEARDKEQRLNHIAERIRSASHYATGFRKAKHKEHTVLALKSCTSLSDDDIDKGLVMLNNYKSAKDARNKEGNFGVPISNVDSKIKMGDFDPMLDEPSAISRMSGQDHVTAIRRRKMALAKLDMELREEANTQDGVAINVGKNCLVHHTCTDLLLDIGLIAELIKQGAKQKEYKMWIIAHNVSLIAEMQKGDADQAKKDLAIIIQFQDAIKDKTPAEQEHIKIAIKEAVNKA